MPLTSAELRERLAATKRALRKAEDAVLAERRREQELDRAYSQATTVRPTAVPPGFLEERGRA